MITEKYEIKGRDFQNAGKASTKIKTMLKGLGISPAIIRRVGIACYEAEMNIVMYANSGAMELSVTPEKIILLVTDEGQGIPDIGLAMKEGYSTATDEMREMGFGAGMGLPNMKRNSDRFDIESEVGKGTKIRMEINLN